jgi:hypothetical protein
VERELMTTVADMTLDELKQFVQATLEEWLTKSLGTLDEAEETSQNNERSWEEVRAAVNRIRWTPPAGSKTSLEFLREDRER